MKRLLPLLVLAPVFANAEQVPHTFIAGTPAKAANVNANFTHVNDKASLNTTSITAINDKSTLNSTSIATIEAKLTTIESAANGSPLDILVNGEIDVEVDCTDKPEALQLAYHKHVNYRTLNFTLTGNCYGDIYDYRDDTDNGGIQVSDQTIGINSADPENRASIIPNDQTGKAFLIAGQGGGLYLSDVNVTTGENEYGAVFFSRNGHGSITNVTINAAGTGSIPVVVQEGAQVYFSNVEINGAQIGIFARNNSTIRFFGETTVNSTEGIVLRTGVSVNQQGTVTINSGSGQALYLNGGVNWISPYADLSLNLTGNIHMVNGSYLNAGTLNLAGDIYLENSTIRSEGFANITGITNLHNSTATFDSGTDAAISSFNCHGISSLDIDGWQKFDGSTVDDSTNCADKAAWNQALYNIFDNLNQPQ
ncbi:MULTISPECIES: hypothetical protein [Colwellia]|uniref:Uncharacterized protein n=1 Tax=Colwellia marinimaniae TaxID=1513592 RepID=A0ABQ0N020_9GAMM|nr:MULTISPECIES: hypothetical protein [Colwellia]GAW97904.1 hypothetical protein MTCD1_03556 [Colwellia marinimaniae]